MNSKSFQLDKSLLLVVLVAIATRGWYFASFLSSPFAGHYRADQDYYRRWAQDIASGNWVGSEVFEQGPLYPYLLGTFYSIFGEQDNLVLVIQMVCGVFTCALVYWCGCKLFDSRTGMLAGLIASVFGPLIFYEAMLMKTFLSPLLTMVALAASLKYRDDRRIRWLVAAGVSVGLACLVRENHVLLLLGLGIWIFHVGREQKTQPHQIGLHLSIAAISFFVTLLPSTIRNYSVSGEVVFVTSGGGEVFYMAHGPDATGFYKSPPFASGNPNQQHEHFRIEAERRTDRTLGRSESSRYWFQQARREVFNDPARSIWLTTVKVSGCLNDFEAPSNQYFAVAQQHILSLRLLPTFGWMVGIGIVGLVIACRDWKRNQLPILMIAAHVASVLLTYNLGRFRIGMMPVWALFAAFGCQWIFSNRRDRRAFLAIGAVIGMTIIALLPPLNYSETDLAYEEHAYQIILAMEKTEHHEPNIERAIHHARDAIVHARDGRKAEAHRALGELLRLQGDLERAEDQFFLAIEADPNEVAAQVGVADILAAEGDDKAAEEHYRLALEADVEHVPANFGMGKLKSRQKKYIGSIKHFEVALAMQPTLVEAHMQLGFANEQLNRDSEAVAHYLSVLDFRTDDTQAAVGAAWLLATSADEGVRNGKLALELVTPFYSQTRNPHPMLLDTLAVAHAENGNFEAAIRYERRAWQMVSKSPDKEYAARLAARIRLFESKKSYRGKR